MRKKILFFLILAISFFCVPYNVKADDYKICLYRKTADKELAAALHVINGKLKFDIYRASDSGVLSFIFTNELKIVKYNIMYGANNPMGKPDGEKVSPSLLLNTCPELLCEANGDHNDQVWIESKSCGTGTWEFKLGSVMTQADISGLDNALLYTYGPADSAKVNFPSIITGGCPSDVAVFKLSKVGYTLVKIASPIALVLFASLDLVKAITSSDESQIKKAQGHLVKRFMAAVIVLLSFVIVELLVGLVAGGSDAMACVSEFLK